MKFNTSDYRLFLKGYKPKRVTVSEACAELAVQASRLKSSFSQYSHDMWNEREWFVSPYRMDEALRLRKIGPDKWTKKDCNHIMFWSFSTVGGIGTYKFILPRFLENCSNYPRYLGWTSQSHVQYGKFGYFERSEFSRSQMRALADSLSAFAYLEIAIDEEDDFNGKFKHGSRIDLLNLGSFRGACRLLAVAEALKSQLDLN